MLRTIILGIVAVVLLAGVESPLTKEKGGKPQAKQKGLQSGHQGFGRLLSALTKAYEENDREKMGQLLEKMNQRRQKQRAQKGKDGPRKDTKNLRPTAGKSRGRAERFHERRDRRYGRGRGFERKGRDRDCSTFRREGRRGRRGGFRREGRGRRREGFEHDGMRRHRREFEGRGRPGHGDDLDEWEHGDRRHRDMIWHRWDDRPGTDWDWDWDW